MKSVTEGKGGSKRAGIIRAIIAQKKAGQRNPEAKKSVPKNLKLKKMKEVTKDVLEYSNPPKEGVLVNKVIDEEHIPSDPTGLYDNPLHNRSVSTLYRKYMESEDTARARLSKARDYKVKHGLVRRGGAVGDIAVSEQPSEKAFFQSAYHSYDKRAPRVISGGLQLVADTPTIDVYLDRESKALLIGIRGTDDFKDLKADSALIANRLVKTKRYKQDRAVVEKIIQQYSPDDYGYYVSGHSLGGALVNQFKRDFPFIKSAVTYNPAFQTYDLFNQGNNIKRNYVEGDFLYELGGKMFRNARVIAPTQAKGFFNRLKKAFTPKGISSHKLDNFKKLYGLGQTRLIGGADEENENNIPQAPLFFDDDDNDDGFAPLPVGLQPLGIQNVVPPFWQGDLPIMGMNVPPPAQPTTNFGAPLEVDTDDEDDEDENAQENNLFAIPPPQAPQENDEPDEDDEDDDVPIGNGVTKKGDCIIWTGGSNGYMTGRGKDDDIPLRRQLTPQYKQRPPRRIPLIRQTPAPEYMDTFDDLRRRQGLAPPQRIPPNLQTPHSRIGLSTSAAAAAAGSDLQNLLRQPRAPPASRERSKFYGKRRETPPPSPPSKKGRGQTSSRRRREYWFQEQTREDEDDEIRGAINEAIDEAWGEFRAERPDLYERINDRVRNNLTQRFRNRFLTVQFLDDARDLMVENPDLLTDRNAFIIDVRDGVVNHIYRFFEHLEEEQQQQQQDGPAAAAEGGHDGHISDEDTEEEVGVGPQIENRPPVEEDPKQGSGQTLRGGATYQDVVNRGLKLAHKLGGHLAGSTAIHRLANAFGNKYDSILQGHEPDDFDIVIDTNSKLPVKVLQKLYSMGFKMVHNHEDLNLEEAKKHIDKNLFTQFYFENEDTGDKIDLIKMPEEHRKYFNNPDKSTKHLLGDYKFFDDLELLQGEDKRTRKVARIDAAKQMYDYLESGKPFPPLPEPEYSAPSTPASAAGAPASAAVSRGVTPSTFGGLDDRRSPAVFGTAPLSFSSAPMSFSTAPMSFAPLGGVRRARGEELSSSGMPMPTSIRTVRPRTLMFDSIPEEKGDAAAEEEEGSKKGEGMTGGATAEEADARLAQFINAWINRRKITDYEYGEIANLNVFKRLIRRARTAVRNMFRQNDISGADTYLWHTIRYELIDILKDYRNRYKKQEIRGGSGRRPRSNAVVDTPSESEDEDSGDEEDPQPPTPRPRPQTPDPKGGARAGVILSIIEKRRK